MIVHDLVDLIVERRGLHRLQHLADVRAVPLDHGLAVVGHVLGVDAAAASHEVALHAALAGVVVDVFGVAVDGVLGLPVVVHKARTERTPEHLAVAEQHERVLAVGVHALPVLAFARAAEAQLRRVEQRLPRQLGHVHAISARLRVIPLVPELDQRGRLVALRRFKRRIGPVLRPCAVVALHIARRVRVVLAHPRHRRARHLEAAASVLDVLVHRIGVEVLRMPGEHVHHALAVLQILVPEGLGHARAGDRGVLHELLVHVRPFSVVQRVGDDVAHLLGAVRRLLALGHQLRLGHVVDLVGDHVVDAGVERVARRGRAALLVLPQLPHLPGALHLRVFLGQLLPEELEQVVGAPHQLSAPVRQGLLLREQLLLRVKPDVARRLFPCCHVSSPQSSGKLARSGTFTTGRGAMGRLIRKYRVSS